MNATGVITNVSSTKSKKRTFIKCSCIRYLLNNDKVNITGKEGNWYRINFKGSVGYVSRLCKNIY